MKFLWRLVWDTASALDLYDADGTLDHGKVMGVLAFAVFLYLVIREPGWPPLAQLTAFLAAMFGSRMFFRFLQRSSFAGSEATSREVKEVVDRRQVDGDGVVTEPAP